MRLGILAVLIFGCFAADANAADRIRYPRVYGATGRPYGPTQAHYQYQRRYGRPWHGYGGQSISRNVGSNYYFSVPRSYSALNYYYGPVVSPYAYSWYGGLYYGGGYPVVGGAVGVPGYYPPIYGSPLNGPGWNGRNPFDNDVLNRAKLEEQLRWKRPLNITPAKPKPVRLPSPSTPAARVKSIAAQARGDFFMENQEYGKAYERYRAAFQAAPERAEPYFRTGFALAALKQFASAVKYFKRGLQLDPRWPASGESLGKIYGRRNLIAKTGIIGDATRWAQQDIRDPDRLFVLGVLLHFDNQTDKSSLLFEAAYRLAGGGEHLKPFLRSKKVASRQGAAAAKKLAPALRTKEPAKRQAGLEPPKPPKPPIPGEKQNDVQPDGPRLPPLPTP